MWDPRQFAGSDEDETDSSSGGAFAVSTDTTGEENAADNNGVDGDGGSRDGDDGSGPTAATASSSSRSEETVESVTS